MGKPIAELLGLEKVQPKNFPKAVPLPAKCPSLLYGLELEIERVNQGADEAKVPGMSVENDGSLRNNGLEFITQPMTYSNVGYCLEMFFKKNKFTDENYSDRTSIHVHTNVQDLSVEQVQTIILLYQTFENLLFDWIGHGRNENIFCVPWSQTVLTYKLFDNPSDWTKYKRWQKYTALNLLPVTTQGTIEWRHMNGHYDVARIMRWLQIIGAIYSFAMKYSLDEVKRQIIALNTTSLYQNILYSVFDDLAAEFVVMPGFEAKLEAGVLDIKYAMFVPNKEEKLKAPSFFDAGQFVNQAANVAGAQNPQNPDDWPQIFNRVQFEPVAVPRPAPARNQAQAVEIAARADLARRLAEIQRRADVAAERNANEREL